MSFLLDAVLAAKADPADLTDFLKSRCRPVDAEFKVSVGAPWKPA